MRKPSAASALHAVDSFGKDPLLVERVLPIFRWLYQQYWRVQVRGIAHVPTRGAALIVSNHSGALPYDGAMIHLALHEEHPAHRQSRFLVEDLVQYLPFVGTFINRVGGVRGCQENAKRLLEAGELVTVFPEGVKGIGKLYRDRYTLARFGRGGIIRLALDAKVPIIPCAVIGAEEIHPILWKAAPFAKWLGLPYIPITPTFPWFGPLGLLPLPSQWVICFGQPIAYEKYRTKTPDDLTIHQLTEQLRDTVQTLVNQGLAERRKLIATGKIQGAGWKRSSSARSQSREPRVAK